MSNKLFYGDNLDILRRKIRDETVDLCYIDPPFNSKRNYFQIYNNVGKDDAAQAQAFIDTWTWNELAIAGYGEIITNHEGRYTRQTIELLKGLKAVLGEGALLGYLVSMTQRVNEIQRVLKQTGSFYLHCDPTASHYLKLVLDSVFCARGGDFKSEISWKRSSAHNDAKQGRRYPGSIRDVIFFYTKSSEWIWNWQFSSYDETYISKNYRHIDQDTGRLYRLGDLTAAKSGGDVSYEFMGTRPYKGRYWAYSLVNMEKFYNEGRLYFPKNGGTPAYKRYLDEMPGVSIQNDWGDIQPAIGNERLGYQTQKPEALLERIIQASSNEGDTVLDAFCGCGTTVVVSQRLRRHWIGIDITYQSIAVILQRLEDSFGAETVAAITLDGIPRDMASARALANKQDDRLRKEFEKWALLTYSKNRATINEKKGADKGIDGTAYFLTGANATARVIFQVKSGKVQRSTIATLNSDRQREQAELAILLTLEEPTRPMQEEAMAASMYHHELLNRMVPRIQIVTIQQMIESDARIDLPMTLEVLKTAESVNTCDQQDLPFQVTVPPDQQT